SRDSWLLKKALCLLHLRQSRLRVVGAEAQSQGVGQLVHGRESQPPLLLQETLDGVHRDPGLLGRGIRRQLALADRLPQSPAHRPFLVANGLLRTHQSSPPRSDPLRSNTTKPIPEQVICQLAGNPGVVYAKWRTPTHPGGNRPGGGNSDADSWIEGGSSS